MGHDFGAESRDWDWLVVFCLRSNLIDTILYRLVAEYQPLYNDMDSGSEETLKQGL